MRHRLLLLLVLVSAGGGCAAAIQCPAGTYPTTAASEQDTGGQGQATVPSLGGGLGWTSGAKATWKCARICPKTWAWDGAGCVQERPPPSPPSPPPAIPAPDYKKPPLPMS